MSVKGLSCSLSMTTESQKSELSGESVMYSMEEFTQELYSGSKNVQSNYIVSVRKLIRQQ